RGGDSVVGRPAGGAERRVARGPPLLQRAVHAQAAPPAAGHAAPDAAGGASELTNKQPGGTPQIPARRRQTTGGSHGGLFHHLTGLYPVPDPPFATGFR